MAHDHASHRVPATDPMTHFQTPRMPVPPLAPAAPALRPAEAPKHYAQIDPVTIGERLRTARYACRLTQMDLACDRYSKSYIWAIERGKMTPSVPALGLLAERLGVPMAYFLGEWELEPPPAEATDAQAHPAETDRQAKAEREAQARWTLEALIQQGAYEAALAHCQEVGRPDWRVKVHDQYAQVLAAAGRYQDAYAQLQQAPAATPIRQP